MVVKMCVPTVAGYDVVRIGLGVLLLTAAALKGYQLATEPVLETSLLTSRWFLIGVVEFELFFGLWLLAGLYAKWTWRATLLCFGGFACVAFYKALAGEASCGCFGKVPVNPWYTLTLDAAAVAALLSWRPIENNLADNDSHGWGCFSTLLHPVRRFGVVVVVSLAIGVPGALAMSVFAAASLTDPGDVFGDGEFVVLEPETWIGKRFPLFKYIDIGDQLAQGEWIVVLYHSDCSKCQDALPTYELMARQRAYLPDTPGVALIEVQRGGRQLAKRCPSCSHGRLTEDRKWLVETPTVVVLLNGAVVSLGRDVESTRFVALGRVDYYTRGTLSARDRMPLKDADLLNAALIWDGQHLGQLRGFRLVPVVSLGSTSSALIASSDPALRRSMSAGRQSTDHARNRKEDWPCDAHFRG